MTRGWAVLGAVALANLVVAGLHFGLAAAGPVIRTQLGIDTSQLGLLFAAPAVGLMLGTYGWGVLADRVSERRVLTGAFVGFVLVTTAAGWAAADRNVAALGIALLGSGLFGSAAHSAGGRAITAAFPPQRQGLVLSIRHTAIPIGGALGGILVPLVARDRGIETAITGCAAFGLGAAVTLAVVIPSSRTATARRVRAQAPPAKRSPLRVGSMWLLAVGAGSLAFVQLGVGSFLTVQLVDRGEFALAAAATVFTVSQLLGGGGRIVLGLWSDRVRERVDVLLGVAAVTGLFVLMSLLAASDRTAALAQAGALVVVTSCNGVVVAVAASLAPSGRTGATLGMQTTANAAACSIAPIVLGVTLEAHGWIGFELVLCVAVVTAAIALSVLRGRIAHTR